MSFKQNLDYGLKAAKNVIVMGYDHGVMLADERDWGRTAQKYFGKIITKNALGALSVLATASFTPVFFLAFVIIDRKNGANEAIKFFHEYNREIKNKKIK